MTAKMKFLTSLFMVTASILLCSHLAEGFHLKDAILKKRSRHHFKHASAPPLSMCPGYPLPEADPSDLQASLAPFFERLAANVSAILKADQYSPGGVVVSVVYRDAVIWTRGFGVVNTSGINVCRSPHEYTYCSLSP